MIHEKLREKTREVRLPLEQPYRQLVVEFLNTVFGNSPRSEIFWDTRIRRYLQSKFCYLREEDHLKNTLFQGVSEEIDRAGNKIQVPNGLWMCFSRLMEMASLKISPNFLQKFSNDPEKALKRQDFMHETDLIAIGERTKQLNIIDFAQGFVFSSRGDACLKSGDTEGAKYFYNSAVEKYEEALHANPYNKWTLVNLAEVLTHIMDMEYSWKSKHQSLRNLATKRICKWYHRAITLDPKDTYTLFSFARFAERHDDSVNPEEFYLRSLEHDPSHFLCLCEYTRFLVENKSSDAGKFLDLLEVFKIELKM